MESWEQDIIVNSAEMLKDHNETKIKSLEKQIAEEAVLGGADHYRDMVETLTHKNEGIVLALDTITKNPTDSNYKILDTITDS